MAASHTTPAAARTAAAVAAASRGRRGRDGGAAVMEAAAARRAAYSASVLDDDDDDDEDEDEEEKAAHGEAATGGVAGRPGTGGGGGEAASDTAAAATPAAIAGRAPRHAAAPEGVPRARLRGRWRDGGMVQESGEAYRERSYADRGGGAAAAGVAPHSTRWAGGSQGSGTAVAPSKAARMPRPRVDHHLFQLRSCVTNGHPNEI